MRRVPRPSKEELEGRDRKELACSYNVSIRTICRWLDFYGLYKPKENYGPYKLTLEQVIEVRAMYLAGWKRKDLAARYGVTFAAISRVIHKITHATHESAIVSVVYNPR